MSSRWWSLLIGFALLACGGSGQTGSAARISPPASCACQLLAGRTLVRAHVLSQSAAGPFARLEVTEVLASSLALSAPFVIEGDYQVLDPSRPAATDLACSLGYSEVAGEVLATFGTFNVQAGTGGAGGEGGEAGTGGADGSLELVAGENGLWLTPWHDPLTLGYDTLTRAQLIALSDPAICEARYPSGTYPAYGVKDGEAHQTSWPIPACSLAHRADASGLAVFAVFAALGLLLRRRVSGGRCQ